MLDVSVVMTIMVKTMDVDMVVIVVMFSPPVLSGYGNGGP